MLNIFQKPVNQVVIFDSETTVLKCADYKVDSGVQYSSSLLLYFWRYGDLRLVDLSCRNSKLE